MKKQQTKTAFRHPPGRDGRIRTGDTQVPNLVLCQTELHPDAFIEKKNASHFKLFNEKM